MTHIASTALITVRNETTLPSALLVAFWETLVEPPFAAVPVLEASAADADAAEADTNVLLSGRAAAAAVGWVPMFPEPTITY